MLLEDHKERENNKRKEKISRILEKCNFVAMYTVPQIYCYSYIQPNKNITRASSFYWKSDFQILNLPSTKRHIRFQSLMQGNEQTTKMRRKCIGREKLKASTLSQSLYLFVCLLVRLSLSVSSN